MDNKYKEEFRAIFNVKMKAKGFTKTKELSNFLKFKPSTLQHFFMVMYI